MKNKLRFVLTLFFFFLIGCSTVCRHNVMSHTVWAIEQSLTPLVVVYEISPIWSLGVYNAHAQIKTEKGWVSNFYGWLYFSNNPDYYQIGWVGEYNINRYLELMKENCFNGADCKILGIP